MKATPSWLILSPDSRRSVFPGGGHFHDIQEVGFGTRCPSASGKWSGGMISLEQVYLSTESRKSAVIDVAALKCTGF